MKDATITPTDNGPYLLKGDVALLDTEGNPYDVTGTIALCRCGHSSTKPFCDGSHEKTNFSAVNRAEPDHLQAKKGARKRVPVPSTAAGRAASTISS